MNALSMTGNPAARGMVVLVALGFMAFEYGAARLARHDTHDLRESAASFAVAVGQALVRLLEAGLLAIPFVFVADHRLFHFDAHTPLAIVTLFFATEFVYYWHHRLSHRVRWLWATHAVHHSPTKLNFTAAIRLGWTANLSGSFVFFLPLVWLGFPPTSVVGMLGLNLLYQFFIHTELVPTLGPLEWIVNTPAQHRVHHASNASCIDRNYGGVLSIFDHLFGTFAKAPPDEVLRYGLVGREPTLNPLQIALDGWADMLQDVKRSQSWSQRLRIVCGPPDSANALVSSTAASCDSRRAAGAILERSHEPDLHA